MKLIPDRIFYAWAEETNQKGGQAKVSKVMKEEDFREWEEYVTSKH